MNPRHLVDAKPTALFTFVTAFSTANYKPAHWDSISTSISLNELLSSDKNDLPWIKFTLELMSLDVQETLLLNKVFSSQFLSQHLVREYNTLDYLQLLTLHQSVQVLCPDYAGERLGQRYLDKGIELMFTKQECPLSQFVAFAYGGQEFVRNKVKTRLNHFLDHVLVFDASGKVVKADLDQLEGVHWNDIRLNEGEKA